ncbi:hypothetical protein EGY25_01960 [Brevundimonas intermedia]|uniref:Uncharacterized protein n=1 Tax=Brevundimonas intermedia TaxID=74315 RepID=A0A4Y9S3B4_9CAUL|nr:hypothetical protein [Brevundimonas intermedia]TFW13998.1 hypothetical protein EGY25_01960 [Brevundimonas intermedia]
MTASQSEFLATLCSIEAINAFLVGVVRTASDARAGEPVILTFVGGEFVRSSGTTFDRHLTTLVDQGLLSIPKSRRKLAPFIEYYSTDFLSLSANPPGNYFVVPKQTVGPDAGQPLRHAEVTTLRFHRAVWAAFIRPLDGKRRFLNLDQIGFTDADAPPSSGSWKEINPDFVLGVSADTTIDDADLQHRIEAWASKEGVQVSKLLRTSAPTRTSSDRLTQLLDLIDLLPPEIAMDWSIPASVLKHLRAAR